MVGCSKFVAPSGQSFEIAEQPGMLWIVPGSPRLADGTLGDEENLLYLLVLSPKLEYSEHGSGTQFGNPSNIYETTWNTPKGKVTISVSWNKRSDTVSVGKRKFERKTGATFVIIRSPNGELRVAQLPSAGPHVKPEDALRFIQEHSRDDTLLSQLTLSRSH